MERSAALRLDRRSVAAADAGGSRRRPRCAGRRCSCRRPRKKKTNGALVKKPYATVESEWPSAATATPAAHATHENTESNQPVVLSVYYARKAAQEADEMRELEAAKHVLPPRSKKTPTFNHALFAGVWPFLFHPNTLGIWGNLIALTLVEGFLLYMMVMFAPKSG